MSRASKGPVDKLFKPQGKPRHCDTCGERYHRRNLVEGWDTQNPGHNTGWNKTIVRICTKCGPSAGAQRLLMVATVIKREAAEKRG